MGLLTFKNAVNVSGPATFRWYDVYIFDANLYVFTSAPFGDNGRGNVLVGYVGDYQNYSVPGHGGDFRNSIAVKGQIRADCINDGIGNLTYVKFEQATCAEQ